MDTTRCATFFAMLVFLKLLGSLQGLSNSIPNFYSGARLYPPPSPRVSSQVPALAKNCDLLGKILGLVSDHGSIGSDSEALTNFDTSIRQPRRPKQSTEIYDIAVAPSDD
ncbi:hypothetical protein MtrunA17_Chr2g0281831 [Medicago truncatula]|uniref:Transmembrane protein n=1 Tax=Medicago truncatula TaxID=3880 RepID=A2Q4Q5_MEDTR|nr:hypothetical protein MtrDRAFT_AC157507g15v2 [Medicago truncatula]RHN71899.1 hypothetical protein MtrunA17_Chr2g0281831 [Medicago truncatula]